MSEIDLSKAADDAWDVFGYTGMGTPNIEEGLRKALPAILDAAADTVAADAKAYYRDAEGWDRSNAYDWMTGGAQQMASELRRMADEARVAAHGIFKLVKDGNVWDMSDRLDDVEGWKRKVLAEEPESQLAIEPATPEEWVLWREQ